MIFESSPITQKFEPYIEALFHYKNFHPDHSIERVVPTGHVFVIFELDGMERHTFDNAKLTPNASFHRVWICGMHKHYLSISAHQDSEMLVIQFKPGGAYPFFHFSISDLNDQIVNTDKLFSGSLITLHEHLSRDSSSSEKFDITHDWLEEQFDPECEPPEILLSFVNELQATTGAQCKDVIAKYQHSHKHLIEQFKKYVGHTPKLYQRILRFNDVLAYLQNGNKTSWAAIAQHCGYTDQSHFIKEFKNFSGFNPKRFILEEFDQQEPNFFPLDRKG